jgi:predicted transcriptional regulator
VKKGVSSVVLYDKSGKVAFSASGTLSAAQRKELVGLVRAELGE